MFEANAHLHDLRARERQQHDQRSNSLDHCPPVQTPMLPVWHDADVTSQPTDPLHYGQRPTDLVDRLANDSTPQREFSFG
jgi:hypothetical protein